MTHEGFYLKGELMNKEQHPNTTATDTSPLNAKEMEQPAIVKKIGNTTYQVKIHFSTTSKETMSDKIKRLIINDCEKIS